MKQNWKIVPLHFDKKESIPTLIELSEKANDFLQGKKVSFQVAFDGADNITVSVDADASVVESLKESSLQLRCELLVDGYDIRKVDYSKIHSVQPGDLLKLASALEIKNGNTILDLMCGYGAVSEHILEVTKSQSISVHLSLCDLHAAQLDRISSHVREQADVITIGDARHVPFQDNHFDAVVIKMGTHEVPQIDQPLVFQEVFRVLKPGGVFVVWDVMPDSGAAQDAFMDCIKVKNTLAGYESIVRDRYFYRQDQAMWLFQQADFVGVEEVFKAHFKQSNLRRLDSELGGDRNKLNELNDYVRQRIPESVRKEVQYEDTGDDISLVLPNRIIRGFKPEG